MVRTYRRKPGSRNYLTGYSPETLGRAIQEIRNGKSIRSVSKAYGIPYGSLYKKSKLAYQTAPQRKHGGQPILSQAEELNLLSVINTLTEWKFPLDIQDIRLLVKNYLDRLGVTTRFPNNMPGYDWMETFKNRHGLTARLAQNIKPSRAEMSPGAVKDFFQRLEKEMEGVEPCNVYNYDETNVTDDPGSKRCITSRGLKRVERKIYHSKQATSIMFCGNADGEYLPPMVVYKAQNPYMEWTKGGPQGTLYSTSQSGWFDNHLFTKWFFELFLPHVKDKPGKKILLGDNLASHFSIPVLEACKENNILFISLVPNSTHLLQPLDVCVFGPAKRVWRKVVEDWRKQARTKAGIPKSVLPSLLNKLCSQMPGDHLKSGFRACGILPLNPQQVLKRLQEAGSRDSSAALNDSVTSLLEDHLRPKQPENHRKRGQRISALAGMAVQAQHLKPSGSGTQKKRTKQGTKPKKRSFAEQDKENESAEEPDSGEEEKCSICERWNPPGATGDKNIKWEGCENCQKWYHVSCIQSEMNDATAVMEEYCDCTW